MFTNMFKCSIRSACCSNPRILRLRMGLCAASVAGELEACRRMYWHRMENLKSAKRILSSPVSCTFGECWQKIVGKVRLMILRAAKAFYFFEISI